MCILLESLVVYKLVCSSHCYVNNVSKEKEMEFEKDFSSTEAVIIYNYFKHFHQYISIYSSKVKKQFWKKNINKINKSYAYDILYL